jgi:glucose/arabinose dehydrogenase
MYLRLAKMISLTYACTVACAALCLVLAGPASAANPPTGFEDQVVASGFTAPTAVASAPDGRTFVAEKGGRVRVITPDGTVQSTPVLDISSQVNDYHDRGLLGIAVDKNFASNGYLYLLYTYDVTPLNADSGSAMVARLSRVTVSSQNTAGPETLLLGSYASGPCPTASNTLDCIPSNGLSHSIGTVRVDPNDGTLWVGVGDSASYTTVDELAFRTYDEKSFAGKILHVDTNGNGLVGHPLCPTDTDLTHVCTKLYAKGFRNPFRFNVRPGKPPVGGDVGWDSTEEVNVIKPGGNYGWPCWEGNGHTPGYRDDQRCADLYNAGGDTRALYTYPHVDGSGTNSAAVVGGPQYTGTDWPSDYQNNIYFGDYAKGFVKRLRVDSSDNCLDKDAGGACVAQPFADSWYGAVDLSLAPGGGIYYVAFGTGGPDGALRRFDSTANKAPTAQASANPRYGPAPLQVSFSSAGSSDPEGATLTYDWDFGDRSAHSTAANPQHTYQSNGSYTARLTVSDGQRTGVATVVITPGNTPPTATVVAPTSSTTYRDGQPVQLKGTATDPEDGTLGDASFSWRVVLVHRDHTHPLSNLNGANTSFLAATDHDSDSFYRITLVATDSKGLDDTKTVDIHAETRKLTLTSTPVSGAPVTYTTTDATTPFTHDSNIGFVTTITAGQTFNNLGKYYAFDSWSDGGARQHDITIPATDSTLTAAYKEDKAAKRPVTASSFQRAGLEADKANDVDSTTRWSSSYADNQWWQVDLGTTRKVDTVELNWESAYASQYKIQTSTDGTSFSDAATENITSKGLKRTTFAARDARYVRVLGVTRATGYGISFWDARVLGPDDAAPPPAEDKALNKPATSSSNYNATFSPDKANDGNSNTRWSSAKGLDNQWWQVDLGAVRKVDKVELNWEAAWARTYKIQTSTDGANFTDAASVSGTGPGIQQITFNARDARYVRVLGLTRATSYGFSFWDARVFGPSDTAPPPPEDKALSKPASSSSDYNATLTPEKGNDGNSSTRWSSAKGLDNQWWQVDLGRVRKVNTVEVNWETAYAKDYRIQTSTDGTNFSEAAAVTLTAPTLKRTTFPSRDARYVRIFGVTRGSIYGFSFWDARVFGDPD